MKRQRFVHGLAARCLGTSLLLGLCNLASAVQKQVDPAVADFLQWADAYAAAPTPGDQAALLPGGEAAALRHRQALKSLIRVDPQRAIDSAVPTKLRARLPASVTRHLEQPVSGQGFFGVMIADDFETRVPEVRREVKLNGRRYEAFVYGRRLQHGSRHDIPLSGVAIDDVLAVDDEPVAAAAAGSGPGGNPDPGLPHAQNSWSQGPKTLLFMPVAFIDNPAAPMTEPEAYSLMDTVNQWYVENSYGTTALIATVTPLLVLPQTEAWYKANNEYTLRTDALDAARAAGFDYQAFDLDAVRYNGGPGSFGGLAYVGSRGCWLKSSSSGVAIHEFGHNYGLWHGNFWTATGDSVIGPGSNSEYGDSFDTMGSASGGALQFNAAMKNQIDWLPDAFVRLIEASGVYRIWTYDVPSLTDGRFYALKIRKTYDRNYWAEFRQKFTSNKWLQNGVLLHWDPWNNGTSGSRSGTHLLDTTPGTSPGKDDSAVTLGRTFSDVPAGVHLTPIDRGTGTPENWIDVVVNLGSFPGNRPPTCTLLADATTVPTNGLVNFTAVAADPDGDPVAYFWDFGDGAVAPNSSTATRSWSAKGHYIVRCTVSDMKGGLFTRQQLVAVGTPTTYTVRGQILAASGEPLEGVRVHNNQTGSAYRGAYTDSEGGYLLANLAAGTNNLQAVKYGYSLVASGWTNPIVTGPDAAGIDFVGTKAPTVALAVTDAFAAEAGPDLGVFTVTRSGPTTTALTVKYNYSGVAYYSSDYSLNSNPTGTAPYSITIPAGASSVSILVQPVNDSQSEGPETVTLTLAEDAAYALAYPAEASVVILDNEVPAKPSVSVTATSSDADNLATEAGDDTGAFVFTRSGNLAGDLTVRYALGGTAVAGADYTPLAGVVTIPDGQSSAIVAFTAIEDIEVEGSETVIATIQSDPAYTISGASATVTILDNDPTTVTVSSTDNVAAETGGNNGVFVITRTGNLAANLQVNYQLGGTAANGADFSMLSGSVTLLAGKATATVTVSPLADALVEGDESVVLTLLSSPVCNVGNPASAALVIQDSGLPTVTLTTPDATASEPGTDTARFNVARTGSTNETLVVSFAVTGTAFEGTDFQTIGVGVVIPAGTNNVDLPIVALDDGIREADEKVTITLLPDPAYNIGTTSPRTITITDDDPGQPGVGFTFAESSGAENDTQVKLSVSLSATSSSTVSVSYAVTGGTATGGGVDFTLANGTIQFPPNATTTNLTFSVNNDSIAEPDETLIISLSSPVNAVLDANPTHTYTIVDDDESGSVTITAIDGAASETGPDPATFRITRSGAATNDLTIWLEVTGTAGAGSDYESLPNSTLIPAGAAFVDLAVMPIDDATDEPAETVIVRLTGATRARLGSPSSATVTIADNDDSASLPVVRILATDAVAAEPGTDTGTFAISLDRTLAVPVVVTFTVGGTASSGTDFNALGTSVTIPAGTTSTNLAVTPRDDASYEGAETVTATLTAMAAYRVDPVAGSAQVTLLDNESGVSVTTAGSTVEDGSATGVFVLTRTGSTAAALTVNYVLSGTAGSDDFSWPGTSIVIPAETNAVALPVMPLQDDLVEGEETVTLRVVAGTGYTPVAPTNATLLILDDEPFLAIEATQPTATEAGGSPGQFTLRRSGSVTTNLQVQFLIGGTAANGVDYSALTNSVVLPAGETNVLLLVTPINDADMEGAETVRITLLPGAGYGLSASTNAVVTILDDDLSPPANIVTIQTLMPIASELGPTNGVLLLARTGDVDTALEVHLAITGTAVNGLDYAPLTNRVTLAAGSPSTVVSLVPWLDSLAEGNETVRVTVEPDAAYAVGAASSAELTILDLPWDAWRLGAFTPTELADPLISGEAADPDRDGLSNLYEYAFGLDPKSPSNGRVLSGAMTAGEGSVGGNAGFVLTYHRRKGPTGLTFTVQGTADLQAWIPADGWSEAPQDDGNGLTELERFHPVDGPRPAGPMRFLRLEVAKP